jgi:hypothetical protein
VKRYTLTFRDISAGALAELLAGARDARGGLHAQPEISEDAPRAKVLTFEVPTGMSDDDFRTLYMRLWSEIEAAKSVEAP